MAAADGALAGRIACVDLETTGGQAARDRVIEAGIVLIEDGAVVEEYSTLVNPGTHIPYAIQQFTGITEAMVADAPPFAAVADDIAARLDGRLFVAHNARFDYGFLRSEFRRLERRLRAPVLCTVRLSRALTPDERGHSLDAVMNRHGIACDARHRALGDARVLAEFLGIARAKWPADELAAIVKRLTGTTRLPPQLDPALADELPEGPGVYLFYGEDDALLYVGKAKNLANRVPRHFAEPHAKLEQQLTRLVRRIEWIETAGEFGALLTEARLIKARKPAPEPEAPRRGRPVGHHACARTGPCRSRRSRCSTRSTTRARATACSAAARMRSARSRDSRASTSCARSGSGSSRARAPASASSSAAAAASASARNRPRCTPCATRLALAGLKRREWPFAGPDRHPRARLARRRADPRVRSLVPRRRTVRPRHLPHPHRASSTGRCAARSS